MDRVNRGFALVPSFCLLLLFPFSFPAPWKLLSRNALKPMESYMQLMVARLSQLERLMSIRLKRQVCERLRMNEKLTQIDVVVIRNEIGVFAKRNSPTRSYVPNSRPVTLFKAFSDASDASRFPRNLPKLRVPVGISTFASTVYVLLVSSLCSIKYFETVSY